MSSLAKRVRDCRYAKGWGPDELASRAEISRTALYQIESGKTELPRAGTLRRIAKALDVSIDVLLGNADVGTFHLPSFAQGGTEPAPAARPDRSAEGVLAQEGKFARSQFTNELDASARERELTRKLHELLASPFGEGIARIVEESHRMLLPHGQGR